MRCGDLTFPGVMRQRDEEEEEERGEAGGGDGGGRGDVMAGED